MVFMGLLPKEYSLRQIPGPYTVEALFFHGNPQAEILHMGAETNFMGDVFFQLGDGHAEGIGPIIQAVPVEGAAVQVKQIHQAGFGLGMADVVFLRIGQWHVLQPEEVIEVQVQQGAVHIQQDGINLVPV